MQFLPATFDAHAHPAPPGGADPPLALPPGQRDLAAARYLCAASAPADLRGAIYVYNHATQAAQYGAPRGPGTGLPPSAAAATAVDYAA